MSVDKNISAKRNQYQEVDHDANIYWQELRANQDLLGNLQAQLRAEVTKELPVACNLNDLSQYAVNIVEQALSPDVSNNEHLSVLLEQLFELQQEVYLSANIDKKLRKRQYINASGLVISPDHCITTIKDTLRVRAFLRGIDSALEELHPTISGPIHIVYPACGPFAPLLLPLLSYYKEKQLYSPQDIRVTLIDIQKGAVLALEAIIKAQEIGDYIDDIICCDAMDFQPDFPIHMVVLEAMQHGFTKEGHLALAYHFSQQIEQRGVLIPQSVSVRAMMNIAQQEYVEQWKTANSLMSKEVFTSSLDNQKLRDKFVKERIELGEILHLDLAFLHKAKLSSIDQYTRMLECNTVRIPDIENNQDKQMLMISTQVNTYGDYWLNEYESGITQPLPEFSICINFTPKETRAGDLLVRSGDSIRFYYCLNGLPGFLATKLSEEVSESV